MKQLKQAILCICLLYGVVASAGPSMRRCMLLPISDSVQGAFSFEVFQELEKYLKDSDWCYYKSNSVILNILGHYKKNLSAHLNNKEVLKILAEKSNAGSLIKVEIVNQVKGVDVELTILGDNGEDIYFREKVHLNTEDTLVVTQTVKNWLDVYEKTIPYDARVIGVLGNQFTMDVGRASGVNVGSEVSIVRPTRKKRHPLLKEIVEWETLEIAKGKIFYNARNQSQGKVLEYSSKRKLQVSDWVRIKESKSLRELPRDPLEEDDDSAFKFGKLGSLSLLVDVGPGSITLVSSNGTTEKISGNLFGVDIKGELWLTRAFWASLDIKKKYGSYKTEEGEFASASNSMSLGMYKFKAGYRYLPMGFFYGPRVDGYVGYGKYSYGIQTSATDGLVDNSVKGIILGTKGSVPVQKLVRLSLELDLLLAWKRYAEQIEVHGGADSVSGYHLEVGGNYAYNPSMTIDGFLGVNSTTAKFDNSSAGVVEMKQKETFFKLGATFTF